MLAKKQQRLNAVYTLVLVGESRKHGTRLKKHKRTELAYRNQNIRDPVGGLLLASRADI